jgi:hypothetical protein
MIEFVAHFSTAEAALGFIVLDGHGTAWANRIGGAMLVNGTYRVENGVLIPVEPSPISSFERQPSSNA